MGWMAAGLVGMSMAATALAQEVPRRSGFDDMGPQTQAMQRDDGQNPGMLWVQDGAALWARAPAAGRPACAACHGDAREAMRGVAARYPAFDVVLGRPVDLGQRIGLCRERRQLQPPWPPEHEDQLALESFVALQSRGMPLAPPDDARLQPWRARGEGLWRQRIGQLNLSCAQCHDERAGRRLAASPIPQGHANGYPLYRLEWQSLGSLQRRLRNCMTGVRAAPWPPGSDELAALSVFLSWRDRGMALEAPAVRP